MENFRFTHKLKVRYSEIDGQKIVFNAHYLTYIDVAVSEYFQEGLQLDIAALANQGEFDFVLAKSTLEYISPARLNDWLTIGCRITKIGNKSLAMNCTITREGETSPLVLGEIIYVSYDPHSQTSRPVPDAIRERINKFEGNI